MAETMHELRQLVCGCLAIEEPVQRESDKVEGDGPNVVPMMALQLTTIRLQIECVAADVSSRIGPRTVRWSTSL